MRLMLGTMPRQYSLSPTKKGTMSMTTSAVRRGSMCSNACPAPPLLLAGVLAVLDPPLVDLCLPAVCRCAPASSWCPEPRRYR